MWRRRAAAPVMPLGRKHGMKPKAYARAAQALAAFRRLPDTTSAINTFAAMRRRLIMPQPGVTHASLNNNNYFPHRHQIKHNEKVARLFVARAISWRANSSRPQSAQFCVLSQQNEIIELFWLAAYASSSLASACCRVASNTLSWRQALALLRRMHLAG